jgi:hypothetical protein
LESRNWKIEIGNWKVEIGKWESLGKGRKQGEPDSFFGG